MIVKKAKSFAGLLLALMLIAAMFPMEALADNGDNYALTWAMVREDLLKNESVFIPAYGIAAKDDDSPLEVPVGKDTLLRMNGDIDRNLSAPRDNGYALIVRGKLTILGFNECPCIKGGKNTGNGGGIYVAKGGTLILNENVNVYGNFADHGGGIYVEEGGTVEIYGMVTGNEANNYGGGIYAEKGSTVRQIGANAEVSNNSAYYGGGGVYTEGTYVLESQKIQSNKAEFGGGVFVGKGGRLIVSGGEISKNSSNSVGGGIQVYEQASAEISGGSIQNNEAGYKGGGIHVEDAGNLKLSGGTVQANNCGTTYEVATGGGIYAVNNNVSVSGSPVVKNNKNKKAKVSDDLYIGANDSAGRKIKVTGRMSDTAEIWVNMEFTEARIFTEGALGKASPSVFQCDDSNYKAITSSVNGETEIRKSDQPTWTVTFDTGKEGFNIPDQIVMQNSKAVDPKAIYKGETPSAWITSDGEAFKFSDSITKDTILKASEWQTADVIYTINYVTGIDGFTYDPKEVRLTDAYLGPYGDDSYDMEYDFLLHGETFMCWCLDRNLQIEYKDESCYDIEEYANEDREITLYAKVEHKHTEIGREVEFQPWPKKDSLPDKAGNYYLLYDVTLDGNKDAWSPAGEVHLCLNGHKIERSRKEVDGSVIRVKEKTSLYLHDCRGTGVITGGHAGKDYGGGVKVEGTFCMYGGTITGNSASNGGGVWVSPSKTFELYGGTISGNTVPAGGLGGGVFTDHYEILNYIYDSVFKVGSFHDAVITIKDNNAGDAQSDVYLPIKGDAAQMKITGPISKESRIGVTVVPANDAEDGDTYWITSGFGDNPIEVFFADQPDSKAGYNLVVDGNEKDGKKEAYIIVDKGGGGDDVLEVSPIKIIKTIKLKYKTLKKKSLTLKRSKIMKVSCAYGKVTYKIVSAKKGKKSFKKNFSVNSKGTLKVKKGTKKGLYKIRIKVTASNGTQTVTVKIRVK